VTDQIHLIDSSVWIRVFRRGPSAGLRSRVDDLLAQGSVAVNQLIKLEILRGARDEGEFGRSERTMDSLIQLQIIDDTWHAAAHLGFRLRTAGRTLPTSDLIIAASALEHDATVVHADKHFLTIAQHSPLQVESYTESSV